MNMLRTAIVFLFLCVFTALISCQTKKVDLAIGEIPNLDEIPIYYQYSDAEWRRMRKELDFSPKIEIDEKNSIKAGDGHSYLLLGGILIQGPFFVQVVGSKSYINGYLFFPPNEALFSIPFESRKAKEKIVERKEINKIIESKYNDYDSFLYYSGRLFYIITASEQLPYDERKNYIKLKLKELNCRENELYVSRHRIKASCFTPAGDLAYVDFSLDVIEIEPSKGLEEIANIKAEQLIKKLNDNRYYYYTDTYRGNMHKEDLIKMKNILSANMNSSIKAYRLKKEIHTMSIESSILIVANKKANLKTLQKVR